MIATGKGLLCPSCGGDQLEVRDSRPGPDSIRRRRQCPCGAPRVSTIETIVGNAGGAKSRTVNEAARSLLSLSSTRRVLVFQLIRQLGGLVDETDVEPALQAQEEQ
jgi:hypothetical protein